MLWVAWRTVAGNLPSSLNTELNMRKTVQGKRGITLSGSHRRRLCHANTRERLKVITKFHLEFLLR